eukprot:CAMPEP_0202083812 /NCGR_PEP_ID=MMETSP0964-20121228/25310_1 /ASSEMBLY_ACC=CAM_ASM_000500 /TAXON_ID=4773 /ORGANISM="Schizochytrium aggregatum, Strain ATCC28209" /LENGTH=207 /DNA_ID=CAMNT_0048651553 /DNA_START=51 /DNA_END=671 /DNA_ORIENTATION=-
MTLQSIDRSIDRTHERMNELNITKKRDALTCQSPAGEAQSACQAAPELQNPRALDASQVRNGRNGLHQGEMVNENVCDLLVLLTPHLSGLCAALVELLQKAEQSRFGECASVSLRRAQVLRGEDIAAPATQDLEEDVARGRVGPRQTRGAAIHFLDHGAHALPALLLQRPLSAEVASHEALHLAGRSMPFREASAAEAAPGDGLQAL